jgi:hypothetical protein
MTKHLLLAKLKSIAILIVNGVGSSYGSGCLNRSGDGSGDDYGYAPGYGSGYGYGYSDGSGYGTGSGTLRNGPMILEESDD